MAKELPKGEVILNREFLEKDERKRDRKEYIYTYDILVKNWVVPFSIWPIPNIDALSIINGELGYNTLPFDDQNEVEKGIFFEDQRQLIAKYMPSKEMLCEVLNYGICLGKNCPLFRLEGSKEGGKYGVCSEYKVAFER